MNMIYQSRNGQVHEVKQNGNRYFYYSRMQMRWFPVAKSKVKNVVQPVGVVLQ